MVNVHIEQGDLTSYKVDAIVNAANNDLILGGGLAGAIARKGGPAIQAECDSHGPVSVAQAAITTAGELPARYVIHQASMSLGGNTTAQSLSDSTAAVLEIARRKELKTIAFPATGTGIAGFPLRLCAKIMLEEVRKHIAAGTTLTDIYFVLYDGEAYDIFRQTHQEMFEQQGRR